MATVERRNNSFRLILYFRNRRYAAALATADSREADNIAGAADRTLSLIRQGVLTQPAEADLTTFVLSGGRLTTQAKSQERPPTSLSHFWAA